MSQQSAFTARAIRALSLDELFRVHVVGSELFFVRIGGQAGVARGVAAQFGLVGALIHSYLEKRAKAKLGLTQSQMDRMHPRDLIKQHKSSFRATASELGEGSIDAASLLGAHGPAQGLWQFTYATKKWKLQFEDVAEMRAAVDALSPVFGPALRMNVKWDPVKGRFVKKP